MEHHYKMMRGKLQKWREYNVALLCTHLGNRS